MQVRAAAMGLKDRNNLRQIMVALHNYAGDYSGALPGTADPYTYTMHDHSAFASILPYLEVPEPHWWMGPRGGEFVTVPMFLSESDPSLEGARDLYQIGPSSYALNMTAFAGSPNLGSSFRDGTAYTIGFAEHYFLCKQRPNILSYWGQINNPQANPRETGTRSATFADRGWGDVVPVTGGNPAISWASVRGKTFQVAPRVEDADGRLPQALQRSGLKVAMFDGSVRTIARSVDEFVFWGSVTRAGGEVIFE
jgi:hypothetical protein